MDINDSATRLVIGSEMTATPREMKMDSGETTFDLQDTVIVDNNVQSGGAYTATMYNTKFVIDDRLMTDNVSIYDDNWIINLKIKFPFIKKIIGHICSSIYSPEKIRSTKPDYVLILPWNLKDEIVKQMSFIRDWNGKFVVLIPEIEIID